MFINCFFLIKSKITIGSYMSFTLDYCLWRLRKEPRNVSSVVNSRDYVQVRNFRKFLQEFLHLNVSMRKSLDPSFSKPCTHNIKHWWFCFCYLYKLTQSIDNDDMWKFVAGFILLFWLHACHVVGCELWRQCAQQKPRDAKSPAHSWDYLQVKPCCGHPLNHT